MKNVVSKIYSEVRSVELEIKKMESEISQLRKKATALRDKAAAIKDARAGIYDKWYRNHREDNSSYDAAWNYEKECMIAEGYEGEFHIIEG